MERRIKYSMGSQTFSNIIEEGRLYLDRTDYMYKMTRLRYVFLTRPRCFGKSLLCSTLRCYFEGRRELFKGLAIESLEKDWIKYPVFHMDMSSILHFEEDVMEGILNWILSRIEDKYGKVEGVNDPADKFEELIKRAHAQTGQKVVIIIDGYDEPHIEVPHEPEVYATVDKVMRKFYARLKAVDEHLQFVFFTGTCYVDSLFQDLEFTDITMSEEYAGMFGFTEEEIDKYMSEGVVKLSKDIGRSYEETMAVIKRRYGGYHFAWPSPEMYIPFNLMNALDGGRLDLGTFVSTLSPFCVNMINKLQVKNMKFLKDLPIRVTESEACAHVEFIKDFFPVMFQVGYLTIVDRDENGVYTLDTPNKEVRFGMKEILSPNYIDPPKIGEWKQEEDIDEEEYY